MFAPAAVCTLQYIKLVYLPCYIKLVLSGQTIENTQHDLMFLLHEAQHAVYKIHFFLGFFCCNSLC